MGILEIARKLNRKQLLFEYMVVCLDKWRLELYPSCTSKYTKLQLQKLLFLTCAAFESEKDYPLLDIFDRFYALPYGPVELDIYEMMNMSSFNVLTFTGNDCTIDVSKNGCFDRLEDTQKEMIEDAVSNIRKQNGAYVTMSPFDLVEITHGWTVWQVAIETANFLGSKMSPMSKYSICNSTIKSF